jgi:hypothetical protein
VALASVSVDGTKGAVPIATAFNSNKAGGVDKSRSKSSSEPVSSTGEWERGRGESSEGQKGVGATAETARMGVSGNGGG